MSAARLEVSYFARDMAALAAFYSALLDAPYTESVSTPIYRGLDIGGNRLGIHDHQAYELLKLDGRHMPDGIKPIGTYITFNLASEAELDTRLARALDLGATLIKGPYTSYYNAYQVVLNDPEGNMFRLNFQR